MTKDDDARLSDPLFLRLFRLFSVFAGSSEERAWETPVETPSSSQHPFISPTQAHFLFGELLREMRIRGSAHALFPIQTPTVSFRDFLYLVQMFFTDRTQFEPVVDRVFDRFVSQIIRKGFLLYRKRSGSRVSCLQCSTSATRWRPAWVTLAPGCIYVWPLHRKSELTNRVSFALDVDCQLQIGPVEDDRYLWRVEGGTKKSSRKIHFAHLDGLARDHWLADMRLAMECCTRRALLDADRRLAATAAPNGDRSLSWRLALESENLRLGKILDDERQALRDEEIVRQLATRMLEEERAKNEKLTQAIVELESQLEVEVERRKLEHLEKELAVHERDVHKAERARHRRRTRELRESRELARAVEVPAASDSDQDANVAEQRIRETEEELARLRELEATARSREAEEREFFKSRLIEEPERSRRLLAEWDKFRQRDEERRERRAAEEARIAWPPEVFDSTLLEGRDSTDIDYLITSTQSI